jgi:hypothetical protein
MSLLDTASLIVTPNAYKEGKLYSVIPSDGSGDLSVTRATTATRVNSAGLVELVPYNLLTWSEDFTNAAWIKNTTVTANTTIAPNGKLTADTWNVVDNLTILRPTISYGAGSYTFSIYVKKLTTNTGTLRFTIVADGVTTFVVFTPTTEWARYETTITANTSFTNIQVRGNTLVGDVAIWGAQLVEGTQAKDYFATETRLNIPRLDYSLGSCPSLLVEPQRTNLLTWSEQFDNASWVKLNATITANSIASPSGVVNADSFIDNSNNTSHVFFKDVLPSSTGVITGTIYMKNNNRRFAVVSICTGVGGSIRYSAVVDLQNGIITQNNSLNSPTNTSSSIESVGNGWYRVSVALNCTTTVPASNYMVVATSNTGTPTTFVTGTLDPAYMGNSSSIYIWGAQLEAGAYPTSYIPTTSASVTRNADVLSRTNVYTNNWITASGGTWFVELTNNRVLTRSAGADIFQSLGLKDALGNGIVLRTLGTQRHNVSKYIANAPTELFATTTDNVKIGVKWNGTTLDVFQNGVKVVSGSAFTTTNMTTLSTTVVDIPKEIKAMLLFPAPLTDAELIQLTTI